MSAWSVYWLCWFAAVVITFAVPEGYALVTGQPQATLSANIWALESAAPGQSILNWSAIHVLVGGGLAVLLIWLIGHLIFRIWT